MNYVYSCRHCHEDITIGVTTARGSVVEADIPNCCHVCGLDIDTLKVLEDIVCFYTDVHDTHKQKDDSYDDERYT